MDNYAIITHTPIPCVQNLRKFELSIRRRSQKKKTFETFALLLKSSTSLTPVLAYSLDVTLDDPPPLILQLLKNNPCLLALESQASTLSWIGS
ncbi:hypothetical protein BGZ47_003193 [Haplosporangium gracile]|nr:hypothetical protein BGZ47_003193 [Haplosporangium gracile]